MSGYKHPVKFVGPGKIAETGQSSIKLFKDRESMGSQLKTGIAIVDAVYADRNTCDVTTWNNARCYNVPLLAQAYLVDDKIYGEFEMPVKGSPVLIAFIDGLESKPYIIGTIVPFLYPKYKSGQVPVNSTSKAYTKKLFEAGKEKYYRKIFQGGTTIEVQDDGTVIVETPSGFYIKIDEGAVKSMTIEDVNGNKIEMTTTSVKINNNLEVLQ